MVEVCCLGGWKPILIFSIHLCDENGLRMDLDGEVGDRILMREKKRVPFQ